MSDELMQKRTSRSNFFLGFFSGMAMISVIGFLALLMMLFGNKQEVNLAAKAGEEQVQEPEQMVAEPVAPISDTDYVKGDKNAKVQVILYTDFECPYCARHYDVAQNIIKKYGDKIAFVVRHYPLNFHPEAQKAAEASECAGEQGKFYPMYEAIFEANKAEKMSVETWKAEAKKLGLNTAKFNDCLDSGKYAQKIADDTAGGVSAGVEGTPATFVNGQLISGAQPEEAFSAMIDELLK
ncbi:MAG: DsbA family protein [Patescibacteria group bacterium]